MVVRLGAKRHWAELDFVCRSGVGIEVIAPDLCRILRVLVAADAGAIFWMGEDGFPAGFFHEDSPAQARDLFTNAYQSLFVGEAELNVASLISRRDRECGHLIAPARSYWRSNTYNLLVRESGHHHALDLRIDDRGIHRAVALLFRERGREPFTEEDAARLQLTLPALRRALIGQSGNERWLSRGQASYLVVDPSARRLIFCSQAATHLLQQANLVAQGIPATGTLRDPPAFAASLCGRLAGETQPSIILAIAKGRLLVSAERLSGEGGEGAVLLKLQHEEPDSIVIMRHVLRLDISPKQRTILMAIANGAPRAEVAAQTRTSPEALKKHLAAIFGATGVRSWTELVLHLRDV